MGQPRPMTPTSHEYTAAAQEQDQLRLFASNLPAGPLRDLLSDDLIDWFETRIKGKLHTDIFRTLSKTEQARLQTLETQRSFRGRMNDLQMQVDELQQNMALSASAMAEHKREAEELQERQRRRMIDLESERNQLRGRTSLALQLAQRAWTEKRSINADELRDALTAQ